MKTELQESINRIYDYLIDSFVAISKNEKKGPGNQNRICQLTLGFEFGQNSWVALVPDYRSDTGIDGEWNAYIEDNMLVIPEWDDIIQDESNINDTASMLGTLLQQVLSRSSSSEAFLKLPLASDYFLTVEHHDGAFGWSNMPVEGQTGDDYLQSLDDGAKDLSEQGKINYWIGVLDRIATGEEERNNDWGFLALDHVIERLSPLGNPAIEALLDFLIDNSDKVEFTGDMPDEEIEETPISTPAYTALKTVYESGYAVNSVKEKLITILTNSISVNESRKLWGTIPAWTARCLHKLFPEYKAPVIDDSTNKLLNASDYI